MELEVSRAQGLPKSKLPQPPLIRAYEIQDLGV